MRSGYIRHLRFMTLQAQPKSFFFGTLEFLVLVYHSIVREVRTQSGNATLGILKELVFISTFIAFFYLIFLFLGRSTAIRGDFMMFLLSGVALLIIHMKAIAAVRSASNATSAVMQHAPMTVILSILAKSFAGLYLHFIAFLIILTALWIFGMDLSVNNPPRLVLPIFLAWASGTSIGLVFLAVKPLAPSVVNIISQLYIRAQMLTSGKIIPAAYMPSQMVDWFDWNPLFHVIDQARLAVFVNYSKEVSSLSYAIWFTIGFLLLGLMGEFWARKNLSKSKHGD